MIITDPDLLRISCSDVLPEEVGELREKLETELKLSGERGAEGIGLACPQIGIAKKMAIVRIPGVANVDLVNCRIKKGWDPAFVEREMCLSFPNLEVRTWRYQEIEVEGNLIFPHRFIAEGIVAICCAHELDHLEGILLPDHLKENQDLVRGKVK